MKKINFVQNLKEMKTIFKDLKVIELANVLAGPAVGMFFAELGANVIKIENKLTNGDVTRSWKLASEDKNSKTSAYYSSVNWNKKSLFVDLINEKEKKKVLALIKNADIIISNYKKGDAEKLGMDYTSIKKINPKIIYGHISGFGDNSSRTAFDIVLQAETGFMFMNGTPESGPIKLPVAIIDLMAAHQLKEGILVALIKRMKTGKGSKVSVSLFDSAIASLANQASNWLMANHNPQPIGSLHPNIAPYGELFITKDNKQIVLAIGSDKQFRGLCEFLNKKELTTNPLFISNAQRVKNRKELYLVLKNSFTDFDSKKIMKHFISNNIPAGIIKSVKEVFETNDLSSNILSSNENKRKNERVNSVVFKIGK